MSTATSGSSAAESPATPVWGWTFVVICVLIPIMSFGGVIPGAIGGGGAFACYRASRRTDRSVAARATICAVIASGCWLAFIAFLALIASVS